MSLDATSRLANVRSRVASYLTAQAFVGAPRIVLDGDARFNSAGERRWVRVAVLPEQGRWLGRQAAGTLAEERKVLVVCDVFVRNDHAEGEPDDVYMCDRIADAVAHSLRAVSLPFLDYSATPDAPAAVAGAPLRATEPPRVERMDSADNYERRQITVELRWFGRHAA